MSPTDRNHFDILIERFSKPAPIPPKDVFNMNWASGVSIAGLIVTYMIVLLQFKFRDA
jgi:hypothetical protein